MTANKNRRRLHRVADEVLYPFVLLFQKYMLDGPEDDVDSLHPKNGTLVIDDVSAVPRFTIE